jgi:hypothetical protein
VRKGQRPACPGEDFVECLCARPGCYVTFWVNPGSQRCSTALVTNIDFESWAEYLGDAPLAMAMLDRVVDGATIIKLKGKSYRVHRGGEEATEK